jgi:pullulanase
MKKCIVPIFALLISGCTIRPWGSAISGYTPNSSYNSSTDVISEVDDSSTDTEVTVHIPDVLRLHYHRDDGAYSLKRFYVWAGGLDGVELSASPLDDFGMIETIHPSTDYPSHSEFKFIIKNANTWNGQSNDTSIAYSIYTPILVNDKWELDVYAIDGTGGAVDLYPTKAEASGDRFIKADIQTDWRTILVETSVGEDGEAKVKSYTLYAFDAEFYKLDSIHQNIKKAEGAYTIQTKEYQAGNRPHNFSITLDTDIQLNKVYQIAGEFDRASEAGKIKARNISVVSLYETPKFKSDFEYQGTDLGVTLTSVDVTFKLWAPTSARVVLYIYYVGTPAILTSDPNANKANDSHLSTDMTYTNYGVWTKTLPLTQANENHFYTFTVYNSEGISEVVDPYAHAAGLNGVRGAIVDFSKTNPDNWNALPLVWNGAPGFDITSPNQLVVSENHIRDLTANPTWNGTSENAGTYKGFYEKGTTYTQDSITVKTGFDHLEELGVNAVQILPFFDADNDERLGFDDSTNLEYRKYNWSYNPLNYSVLDGAYSLDPEDPYARVKEFKELVYAYGTNANKTRIIMDVVYNHVSSVGGSNLTKIMPKYYFRTDAQGWYTNGSGVGNETKSEAPMFRKLIVDSLVWWATEYKIKGFRFDLMGLLDVETIRLVKDTLYSIDPDIVVYGEGWTGDGSHWDDQNRAITSSVYTYLFATSTSPGHTGAFNDSGRNAIRGGNDNNGSPTPGYGYISKGGSDLAGNQNFKQYTVDMLQGVTSEKGTNPYQTVNYASCHDNYTLYDQLYGTLGESNTPPTIQTVAKGSVAVNSLILFSQGISFINGGEELFRSKEVSQSYLDEQVALGKIKIINGEYQLNGEKMALVKIHGKWISHNSYNLPDEVNSYDYSRKVILKDYFDKYVEAINIRKQIPHFAHPYNTSSTQRIGVNSDEASRTSLGYVVISGSTKYVVASGGRELNNEIWTSTGGTYTLIYNSTNINPTFANISESGRSVYLGQYQTVIYKVEL